MRHMIPAVIAFIIVAVILAGLKTFSCEEHCLRQPHIECFGYWKVGGLYPDCECEYICSTECDVDENCTQPRCLGMKAVCEENICKVMDTTGIPTRCGE